METRQNLRISGVGSANGGKYNEVRISGTGSVNGDVDCNLFKTSGASDVKGNVKAKTVDVSGASDIKGGVNAEEIYISGASHIHGDVETKKVKISGASDIRGNLHAENVEVSGAIDIKGDCEAESFRASGGFKIGGLLNADNIEIGIGGKCNVREMGGEKITVRMSNGVGFGIIRAIKEAFNVHEYLITELIEGDEIYVENTVAKVIRGNDVIISSDCDIDLVEYKNTIKVMSGARVKEQKKI
jgi:cytoskeletal protein CcmA (bactofilin family)